MPANYRALIVILILSFTIFAVAKMFVTSRAIPIANYISRRNAWISVTLLGFICTNFWVFALVCGGVIFFYSRREENKIALFVSLLFAFPLLETPIPGFGGVNYFIQINYYRLLALLILFPLALKLSKQDTDKKNSSATTDLILYSYIGLNLILQLARGESLTEFARSVTYWFIDVLLPYYTISRAIRNIAEFREILMSLIVAGLLISSLAVFEFLKGWLLYSLLGNSLGLDFESNYLGRGDVLRASATAGHPIVLGYILVAVFGIYLYCKKNIESKLFYFAGLICLSCGVVAPLSRGPWVGLGATLLTYWLIGPKSLLSALRTAVLVIPIILVLLTSQYAEGIIAYLPFIGSIETGNITYRQDLFDTSITLILKNPLFGSADYLLFMEHLRQGEGIIDLVNTYLIIALNVGFVGLFLFAVFFLAILSKTYSSMRMFHTSDELYLLGQSLIATLVGLLVIIATVSPIYLVPTVLWVMAALATSYTKLISANASERLSRNLPIGQS